MLPPGAWESLPSRVEENTRTLLDLLEARSARATFFTLGWVAARHQRLLQEIEARGHELATHGYLHRSVAAMTEAEFLADLRRARETIEAASRAPVVGYRAARWSLGGAPGRGRRGRASGIQRPALEILARERFRYDASLAPIVHVGDPDWPIDPYVLETAAGPMREFPPLVGRVLGVRLLLAGGWALRRVPNRAILREIARRNRRGAPAVLDLHVWEFDPDPPRVPLPLRYRIAHYGGLQDFHRKIDDLLSRLRVVPIRDFMTRAGEVTAAPGEESGAAAAPGSAPGGPGSLDHRRGGASRPAQG